MMRETAAAPYLENHNTCNWQYYFVILRILNFCVCKNFTSLIFAILLQPSQAWPDPSRRRKDQLSELGGCSDRLIIIGGCGNNGPYRGAPGVRISTCADPEQMQNVSCNKQVSSESSNARLKPMLESNQRSIDPHHQKR